MDTKQISDMYLAAALLSYGVRLTGIDRKDPKRQKFCFTTKVPRIIIAEDDVKLTPIDNPILEDVERYFLSKILWLPPSYPDALKSLKSAIYST